MTTKSKTCVLIILLQIINTGLAQDAYKRSPQGFLGMRGKKLIGDEHFYKRKPQFFVGVKGKKSYEIEDFKRTPMGFVGMRGKKDFGTGSLIGEIEYSTDYSKPNEVVYLKQMISNYLEQLAQSDESQVSNEIEKRSANYHQFFGVRGKKSIQSKRPFDLNFRGKFIGVRGKKDMSDENDYSDEGWVKRKAQTGGFFGMRGKKAEGAAETAEIN